MQQMSKNKQKAKLQLDVCSISDTRMLTNDFDSETSSVGQLNGYRHID